MQWSTTSQVSSSQGVKMLVYSEAGAGKTILCATAPRPVVISAEAGLLSLHPANVARVYGHSTPGIAYDIPVLQVANLQQLEEAYQYFANPANRASDYFDTICLDSITEIAEVVLATAKRGTRDPRQAYGELIDKMTEIVRKFRDLPGFHVYMSAKMEPQKDGLSGAIKYMPSMPGSKVGPMLPYFFDEVFRLGIGKTQDGTKYRFLQTDGDLQFVAKDRSGSLDEIEMPALYNIIHKIQGAAQ